MRRLLAPFRLRALVRRSEIAYTVIAAVIGIVAGGAVVLMQEAVTFMAVLIFNSAGEVSGAESVNPLRALSGPLAGGILLGASYLIGQRWFRRVADPIEANAVTGGKIAVPGSLFISGQTMVSSGFGASVGMEAAYTQAASALASWGGQKLRLRREDLRQLVAAGAGGAIAAAFDAPLTGAFYAFELVLASYTVAALLPVLAAAISATAVTRLVGGHHGLDLYFAGQIPAPSFIPIAVLAVISAVVGILIMRAVSATENTFRKSVLPGWSQPVVGGLCVGLLALATPRVLSSGHGAMDVVFGSNLTLGALVLLFVLKALASVISIGSGFRGGLFFASLLLGAILGKILGIAWLMAFGLELPIVVFAVVGMCALATAVIGAPLAMCFLALETTKSLPLALAVLFAALIATAIVRQFFGFSFSTWRFHIRGETIRSAADIGWVRELSVGKMMRRVASEAPASMKLAEARRRFPPGSTKAVPMVDDAGRYAGLCITSELYGEGLDPQMPLASIAHLTSAWLRPDQTVREAILAFGRHEADTLAVLDADHRVLGTLNEQYCLRRYSNEVNRRLYPQRG